MIFLCHIVIESKANLIENACCLFILWTLKFVHHVIKGVVSSCVTERSLLILTRNSSFTRHRVLDSSLERYKRSHSYSQYWTRTSLQPRLMWEVFSNANDMNLFLMIFPRMSHHCKLVPVQYREYDINLFLMISPHMSLHSKPVPVQYWEYDMNLSNNNPPHEHPFQASCSHYREYGYDDMTSVLKLIFFFISKTVNCTDHISTRRGHQYSAWFFQASSTLIRFKTKTELFC